MYFLDLNFVVWAIRMLMAMLCGFIYPIVGWLFNLFMNISKVSILGDAQIKPIYQRITMILTIIMIFYVTFEFVKYVVQPDGITDKEKGVGKIVYKLILVVVLIAFVPTIFSYAYKLQGAIMDRGLIGNVIIGKANVDPDKLGSTFSANLLSLFYSVDEENKKEKCAGIDCGMVVQMNLSSLQETGDLANLTIGMDESVEKETNIKGEKTEMPVINFAFHGFLPVIVGVFVGYILVIYCIDLGTRWAQLVFLQIIAPIPIIGYLSPKKDGIFQKWGKQCLTTYLDLFIRTALIYFVLLITSVLMDGFNNGNLLKDIDPDLKVWVYIILILGVMLFLQKAPKMLKELFPSTNAASGNFGLKAGERVAPMAARALGAGLGATRAIGGAIARGANRAMRNKANGAKPNLFTKEGREQAAARKANRAEASTQKRRLATQNRMNSRVSEEEMSEAKGRVQAASAAAKQKRAEIQKDLEAKGLKGDALTRAVNQEMVKSKEHADLQKEAANYRNLNAQRNALVRDENGKVIGSSDKDIQKMRDQVKEQSNTMQDTQQYQDALSKLRDAEATGDDKLIAEAKKELGEIKQNATGTSGREYSETLNGSAHETENKLADALSRVAKDKNERYRSVVGASVSGALSGAWTGITTGGQATKLEDVWKKGVTETRQKDVKNIQAVNKYYDEGGTGFVNRVVTQIEKQEGIDTAYTRSNLQTQALSSKIKEYDETITRSDNLKKSFDSTEDRLKNKIDESKVVAPEEKTLKTLPDGTALTINKGETVAAFNARYRSIAKDKQAVAEAASKTAQDKYSELKGNAKAKAEGTYTGNLTAEEQKAYDEYIAAQETARTKALEATNAENAATQATKYGARHTMTMMLQGKVAQGQVDEVAAQYLEDTKNDAAIARKDPEIVRYIQNNLALLGLSTADFSSFISGKFVDYDQLDRVKNAINKVRNEKARQKQVVQDQKTRIESSHVTQAQKAANDYNGGSGK